MKCLREKKKRCMLIKNVNFSHFSVEKTCKCFWRGPCPIRYWWKCKHIDSISVRRSLVMNNYILRTKTMELFRQEIDICVWTSVKLSDTHHRFVLNIELAFLGSRTVPRLEKLWKLEGKMVNMPSLWVATKTWSRVPMKIPARSVKKRKVAARSV